MTQFEVGDRGRLRRPRRRPGRGGGDRGRAGRQARRDQHDPLAGHRADLGRPRPHRVAGRDRGWRSPPRSWPCCATTRPWCSAGSRAEVAALAERTAAERGAPPGRAPEDPGAGASAARRRAPSSAATSPSPAPPPRPSSASSTPSGCAEVAATLTIPGRLERIAERPADLPRRRPQPRRRRRPRRGAARRSPTGRRVVACLAILADKDAEAMVAALAPALERAVCTELPRRGAGSARPPRRRLAARRRELARDLRGGRPGGRGRAATSRAALRRGRASWPPSRTASLLVTGSHYVAGARRGRCASDLTVRRLGMDRGAGSELLSMMALVAAVVAA